MRRALLPVLLLLLACAPAAEGPFFEVEEALGRAISQTPGATGGAVAIHRGEQVVFESAGGRVRAGLGAKVVGPETLFKMESVSKTVAALTALQLVKEGKLSLDARLSDVMPGWTGTAGARGSAPSCTRAASSAPPRTPSTSPIRTSPWWRW